MPELSTAPSDSAVTGAEKLLTLGFENVTVQQVADANESKSADIASATTTDLATMTTPYGHVTGTVTITGFGTVQAGAERMLVFDGVLTLTHNGTSLILPTGANITTAAGDAAIFRSEGAGNWRCVVYQRKDGSSLAGGAGSVSSVNGATGAVVLTEGDIVATITTYTASQTSVLADEVVQMNVASANDFTIPPNSSVAIPVGAFREVWQVGAGQTTIVAGVGVTILYAATYTLKLREQNSGCSLRKVATDTWRLIGDMEPL